MEEMEKIDIAEKVSVIRVNTIIETEHTAFLMVANIGGEQKRKSMAFDPAACVMGHLCCETHP
eukprot:8418156-Ditylum_brightwellii.AAC.1